ncbi:MAG: uracil-DNA glycosylase [Saprospiraceae bacterium]
MSNIQIAPSWKAVLAPCSSSLGLGKWLPFCEKKAAGKVIYPPGNLIFNAFNTTPFEEVKVVILGQDPYHNPGQAMGLSFSVPKGVKPPPSLGNIYKELQADVGIQPPAHGDLTAWAQQGVFLLNAMLTVEKNKPSSHSDIGWQQFTDAVIQTLSEKRAHLVFLLWGLSPSKKAALSILQAPDFGIGSPQPLFCSQRLFRQSTLQ